MGDGLPWLLTDPRFCSTMKDYEEAKEAEKVDKKARKVPEMSPCQCALKQSQPLSALTLPPDPKNPLSLYAYDCSAKELDLRPKA